MSSQIKIKICGITNEEDYLSAISLGADYVGFVFYKGSPRYVSLERVMEITEHIGPCRGGCSIGGVRGCTAPRCHKRVGVFVNESIERVREIYNRASLDIVQLHGDESVEYIRELGLRCWKVFRIRDMKSFTSIKNYFHGIDGKEDCGLISTYLLDTYLDGNPSLYGGTGKPFDYGLIEMAFENDLFEDKRLIISGGISSENLERVMGGKYEIFGVDVNSSIEQYPGKKDGEKMEKLFHVFNSLRGLAS